MVYEQCDEVLVSPSSESEVRKVSYILYAPPHFLVYFNTPLLVTLVDFWTMVYEQGVEDLVTLSSGM